METTTNGIKYTEAIVSINGASFILFPDERHTLKMVAEAKQEIRHQRDVVSISVATEEDRDKQYRSEIYRHPLTHPLRWYEINADDYLSLREHRLKQTSIDDYLAQFVMPFTARTKAANLERFGDKIFEL